MAIDPNPLVWADYDPVTLIGDPSTTTSAANFNRITAEVASEVEERIARARVLTKAADDATYAALSSLSALAPLASPAFTGTPTGITKAHVGLSAVDNTADSAKPVSTAQAAADTAAKARANHTGTQLSSTISDFTTAAAAAGAGGGNISGTYAARPAANSVPSGFIYYGTDVPETYRSNGTVWSVVGSGGNELGYAETTANTTSLTGTPADVPGLSVTFIKGERPFEILLTCEMSHSQSVGGLAQATIWLNGYKIAWANHIQSGGSQWLASGVSVRFGGLTPGSTNTAKIMFANTGTGGTASFGGNTFSPSAISVITR